jgi:hypothetical protein
MVLAGESGLDGSRALKRKGVSTRKITGWVPVRTLSMTTGWLVRTSSYSVDIQRAGGQDWSWAVWESRRLMDAKGELRRVAAAVAKPSAFPTNDINSTHDSDRIPPSDKHHLFPLVILDMSRAGQISRCIFSNFHGADTRVVCALAPCGRRTQS